jgi:hypothetical protein
VQRIAGVSRPNAMVVEDDYDWRIVHRAPRCRADVTGLRFGLLVQRCPPV